MGRQSLDDPAVGDRAAAALFDHAIQFTPQGLKVGDLAIDLGAMLPSNAVDRLAGPFSLVGQGEQCSHLLQRKTDVPSAAYEAQPIQILRTVCAIIPSTLTGTDNGKYAPGAPPAQAGRCGPLSLSVLVSLLVVFARLAMRRQTRRITMRQGNTR